MIFRVIWFGGGSVDRTLWFGGSAEPHRTTKFGRTRSRSRTVRSFTIIEYLGSFFREYFMLKFTLQP